MRFIGPEVPNGGCGFSPDVSDRTCGATPLTIHGRVLDAYEGWSFVVACVEHVPIVQHLTVIHHQVEPPCLDLERGYWLDMPDGRSFCYRPDAEAGLQEQLAAGATARALAAVMVSE